MVGGATAVVTLLPPEDIEEKEPEDEQFHVLPLYVPDCTEEELAAEVSGKGLVVLDKFTRTIEKARTTTMVTRSRAKTSQPQPFSVDCMEAFRDPNIGGVAFALTHGSILIEQWTGRVGEVHQDYRHQERERGADHQPH